MRLEVPCEQCHISEAWICLNGNSWLCWECYVNEKGPRVTAPGKYTKHMNAQSIHSHTMPVKSCALLPVRGGRPLFHR